MHAERGHMEKEEIEEATERNFREEEKREE